MASKKRWDTIYESVNPFALPQYIANEIKSAAHARSNGKGGHSLDYLWVYVTPVVGPHARNNGAGDPPLATDEWLSILDEAAALGTECVVVSTGAGLDDHPEILAMCSWAQETHEMLVGLHVYNKPLSKGETKKLTTLDQRLFGLFIDSEIFDRMSVPDDAGIHVYRADCDGRETMTGDCTHPAGMTCVGPDGRMFGCGYVYGSEKYAMGHCFEKELGVVMADDAIERMIPRGDVSRKRRCNGCPPLMQRMLENAARGGSVSKSNGNGKRR